MSVPLLQLEDIGFQVDQFAALEHINWEIHKSNLYLVIGANASGKTTLLSLIAGIRQPTNGAILWQGKSTVFRKPQDAYRHGIILMSDVPQLFPNRSVTENVVAVPQACASKKVSLVLPRHNEALCHQIFEELDIQIDPQENSSNLNLFQQRLVELARVYYQGASLVLMDALCGWCTPEELSKISRILEAIRRKYGCAVITCATSVEHIIPECTSILYLKSGTAVACVHRDQDDLLQIPADFQCAHLAYPKLDLKKHQAILHLEDFELPVLSDSPYALPSDLVLHSGEMVGIYGMDLPHCQAICEIFTGQRVDYHGQIVVNDLPVRIQSPQHALRLGIACQPLMKSDALYANLDMYMNLFPPNPRNLPILLRLFPRYQRVLARYYAKRTHINPPDTRLHCRLFSSANQQKILLLRYLSQDARVFILFNPTYGMDNQAKLDIYNMFTSLQQRGCSIILFSNDLDELAYMCDSIRVTHASGSHIIRGTSAQRAEQLYSSIMHLNR